MRRVRRSCGVLAQYVDGRLCLTSPLADRRVPYASHIAGALDACELWTPVDEVPLHPDGVEYLLLSGLLVEEGTATAALDDSMRSWAPWGADVISSHLRARRHFVDHRLVESLEEAAANLSGPSPPLIKTYPDALQVALPPPGCVPTGFEATLRKRRTWRSFGEGPVGVDALSTLLGLSFGATGRADSPPFGETLFRTSPSAGGRHPVEAYVCALDVEGLDDGVYHYAVCGHVLERLEAKPGEVVSCMVDGWAADASAVCFLTAVVARCRWKYPFGRMYRTLLLDVGHVAQTFVLTATALDLAPFQTAAFRDPLIEDALALDAGEEPVLHAVGVGSPPEVTDRSRPGAPRSS